MVGASVVAIVAAIVLGVLAATWSSERSDARRQASSVRAEARAVHVRGLTATREADRLRGAADKTSTAVDDFVTNLQNANAAQVRFSALLNAAITQASNGDGAGSQSSLAGDGAAADADLTTKTNVVHSSLATLEQVLATLKAATGG
jgi:hypothetical protein